MTIFYQLLFRKRQKLLAYSYFCLYFFITFLLALMASTR